MTVKNSNSYRRKPYSSAITVEANGTSNMLRTAQSNGSTFSLRALNDFCIIEEDPIELTADDSSGLTADVIDSLKSGKLVLPEIAEGFADKYPFRGRVIAAGPQVKEVALGDRVIFPRLGGMRWKRGNKQYINIRSCDLHAVIN